MKSVLWYRSWAGLGVTMVGAVGAAAATASVAGSASMMARDVVQQAGRF